MNAKGGEQIYSSCITSLQGKQKQKEEEEEEVKLIQCDAGYGVSFVF